MIRMILLIALMLASCRRGDPNDQTIDACLAAMLRIARERAAGNTPDPTAVPSDAGRIAQACAPLYRDPICREAHLAFDRPPIEARAITVARACADSYCPKLAEPRPALCRVQPNPSELPRMWQELTAAIWRYDLGQNKARRLLGRVEEVHGVLRSSPLR